MTIGISPKMQDDDNDERRAERIGEYRGEAARLRRDAERRVGDARRQLLNVARQYEALAIAEEMHHFPD